MISEQDFITAHRYRAFITSIIYKKFLLQSFRFKDDLDDLVSDIVIKVAGGLMQYQQDPKAEIQTWIGTITINHVTSYLRARLNQRISYHVDDDPIYDIIDHHFKTPEDAFFEKERIHTLKQHIHTLPLSQRYVIELLSHQNVYSYEEIAARTNQSVSAVKSIIFRVRQKMNKGKEAA
jgi:RNA polymerase sigma factor (sigma-70 family)